MKLSLPRADAAGSPPARPPAPSFVPFASFLALLFLAPLARSQAQNLFVKNTIGCDYNVPSPPNTSNNPAAPLRTITMALFWAHCQPGTSWIIQVAGTAVPYDDLPDGTGCPPPYPACPGGCPTCPPQPTAQGQETFPLIVRRPNVQIVWDRANSDPGPGGQPRFPTVQFSAPPGTVPLSLLQMIAYANPPPTSTTRVEGLRFYGAGTPPPGSVGAISLQAPLTTPGYGLRPTLDGVTVGQSIPAISIGVSGVGSILAPTIKGSTLSAPTGLGSSPSLGVVYAEVSSGAILAGSIRGNIFDGTLDPNAFMLAAVRLGVREGPNGLGGQITTAVEENTIAGTGVPNSGFQYGAYLYARGRLASNNAAVSSNRITGTFGAAVMVAGLDGNVSPLTYSYPKIERNTIIGCSQPGGDGAVTVWSRGASVTGGGTTITGFRVKPTIRENTIQGVLSHGVEIRARSVAGFTGSVGYMGKIDVQIRGNSIQDGGGHGVYFDNVNAYVTGDVEGNKIFANAGDGIYNNVNPAPVYGAVGELNVLNNFVGLHASGTGVKNSLVGPVAGNARAKTPMSWNTVGYNAVGFDNVGADTGFQVWNTLFVSDPPAVDITGTLLPTSFFFCRSATPVLPPGLPYSNWSTAPVNIRLMRNGGPDPRDFHLRPCTTAGFPSCTNSLGTQSWFHDRVSQFPTPNSAFDIDGDPRKMDSLGFNNDCIGDPCTAAIAEGGADEKVP